MSRNSADSDEGFLLLYKKLRSGVDIDPEKLGSPTKNERKEGRELRKIIKRDQIIISSKALIALTKAEMEDWEYLQSIGKASSNRSVAPVSAEKKEERGVIEALLQDREARDLEAKNALKRTESQKAAVEKARQVVAQAQVKINVEDKEQKKADIQKIQAALTFLEQEGNSLSSSPKKSKDTAAAKLESKAALKKAMFGDNEELQNNRSMTLCAAVKRSELKILQQLLDKKACYKTQAGN